MIRDLLSLYSYRYVLAVTQSFAAVKHDIGAYVKWYSSTPAFRYDAIHSKPISPADTMLRGLLYIVQLGIVVVSGLLVVAEVQEDYTGGLWFGLALLLATPLLLAALVPLLYIIAAALSLLVTPKQTGKAILCVLLEYQVRRLRKAHTFTVVAVLGSAGKTSTKLAVANVLKHSGKRVRFQDGNYNDRLTVPLVFFGKNQPNIFNILAWAYILISNERAIHARFGYNVVVVELGTDGPGQIAKFAYIKPELTVITSVAPEHMEFFGTVDAVAAEELSAVQFSRKVLIGADDVAEGYLRNIPCIRYGTKASSEYVVATTGGNLLGQDITIAHLEKTIASVRIQLLGASGKKIALAAAAVAEQLGVVPSKISSALATLSPSPGRMQALPGIKNSVLLDDTYNATPTAVLAALEILQATKAPQRIAVLGSMNELGYSSSRLHREVAEAINPKKVAMVVTIGQEAHDYIAVTARNRGCNVRSFMNPLAAGEYLQAHIANEAVVLCKGSQNGVFAEEAIKPLLKDPGDARKLVRQSPYWMNRKASLLRS